MKTHRMNNLHLPLLRSYHSTMSLQVHDTDLADDTECLKCSWASKIDMPGLLALIDILLSQICVQPFPAAIIAKCYTISLVQIQPVTLYV